MEDEKEHGRHGIDLEEEGILRAKGNSKCSQKFAFGPAI